MTVENVYYRGWEIVSRTEHANPKLAEGNQGVFVIKVTETLPDREPACRIVWIEIPFIHSRVFEASETLFWQCSCDWRCSNAKAAKGKVKLRVPMENGGFVADVSVVFSAAGPELTRWSYSAHYAVFHAEQPPAEYVDR